MEALDLHKVRLFYTVARLGSFTQAADQLHMTQPTVSQQVAVLEQILGVMLFERTTRTLRLTDAGQILYEYAERLLALSAETITAVQIAGKIAGQTLKLGVGHTLATYLLPRVLSQFRARFPAYQVRLTVGNTRELLTMLAAAEIDLALVGSPAEHPQIMTQPFMRDHLRVIVSPSDTWAAYESVTLEDVRERILLTREPGSALYTSVVRLLGTDFLQSESVILLGETEAIKRSVELGLGVALIQGIAIEREVFDGRLRVIPLRECDDSRTYLVASRKQSIGNESAARFLEVLRSAVADQ